MAEFQIRLSANDQYYFNFIDANSNVVLRSEQYTTKSACKNGIDSVKTNAPLNNRYDKQTASDGKYYFNLKAGNGEIIGTSKMYTSSADRDAGIDFVKSQAPTAAVKDLS